MEKAKDERAVVGKPATAFVLEKCLRSSSWKEERNGCRGTKGFSGDI